MIAPFRLLHLSSYYYCNALLIVRTCSSFSRPFLSFQKPAPIRLYTLFRRSFSLRSGRFRDDIDNDWRIMDNERDDSIAAETKPSKATDNTTAKKMYTVCLKCHGKGKISKGPSRKARLRYKRKLDQAVVANDEDEDSKSAINNTSVTPPPPPTRLDPCSTCQSTGLRESPDSQTVYNHSDLPHVAIVGGGIGGLALAIACRHRGIPHTVFERDAHFSQRRQGYGLTLQQASKALKYFGNADEILKHGVTSTKHVVHKPNGNVVGEWGLRKWGRPTEKREPKRQNVHIARQALRYQLLKASDESRIEWNSRLVSYKKTEDGKIELTIAKGDDTIVTATANVLVGADGIRSQVRQQLVGETSSPLRYLDCLVVLGICPLSALDESIQSNALLDGETVFQTADGTTRIYMMPYSSTEYMWQLSYPMAEEDASRVSVEGPEALKTEALKRCGSWHDPVPQILQATPISLVSGYPVYDRALLEADQLCKSSAVTLIGDSSHPMSPFKGQGANQAMLDALSLANEIYYCCHMKKTGLTEALQSFEAEMLARSAVKVQASAEAAKFLHSEVAIQEGNVTRGAANQANEMECSS